MGLTSALSTSRSGLLAIEKWSETTASNIANASSEGYVRKSAELSTKVGPSGAQVMVTGIKREVDTALDRMHRTENSRVAKQQAIADGLEYYTGQLGQPGGAQSPSEQLNKFFGGLDLLVNNPANPALQRGFLDTAQGLAASLNRAATSLGQTETDLVAGITRNVETVNATLHELADLNLQLSRIEGQNMSRATLEDEIGRTIDKLSEVVDLRVTRIADGRVSVFSAGGTPLLEVNVVHDISYDRGSGSLTAGGADVTPGVAGARGFENGSLAGQLTLQNELLPRMRLQLDEFARVLVQGFQAADASLAPGQAGLFTDAGAAFDPAQLDGLAGRLSINDAVRPETGGSLWRLRDGIGAAAPGPASDGGQLTAFVAMLDGPQSFSTGAGLGTNIDLTQYSAGMIADQQVVRTQALDRRDALSMSAESIGAMRRGVQGVNIDDELQQLILIEQSYAANSKVMSAVADMIDTLLASL